MKNKGIIFVIFITFMAWIVGCITDDTIYYAEEPYRPAKVKSAPSLAKQLDGLYQKNYDQWKNKMRQIVLSGNDNIPSRHLIRAVQEFNSVSTRKQCLEAAFLYLKNKAKAQQRLRGDDRELFQVFTEYVIKHPESRAMNRVKGICALISDDICDTINN
ncbi:hypothetical protein GMMP15_90077 [Candidatus Magnetomoraceae bacterium gMMP-15]